MTHNSGWTLNRETHTLCTKPIRSCINRKTPLCVLAAAAQKERQGRKKRNLQLPLRPFKHISVQGRQANKTKAKGFGVLLTPSRSTLEKLLADSASEEQDVQSGLQTCQACGNIILQQQPASNAQVAAHGHLWPAVQDYASCDDENNTRSLRHDDLLVYAPPEPGAASQNVHPAQPSISVQIAYAGPTHVWMLDTTPTSTGLTMVLPASLPDHPLFPLQHPSQPPLPASLVQPIQQHLPTFSSVMTSPPDSRFNTWLSDAATRLSTHNALAQGSLEAAQDLLQQGQACGDAVCTAAAAVALARLARQQQQQYGARAVAEGACSAAGGSGSSPRVQVALQAALQLGAQQQDLLNSHSAASLLWAATAADPPPPAHLVDTLSSIFTDQLPGSSLPSMALWLSSLARLQRPLPPPLAAAFFHASRPHLPTASLEHLSPILQAAADRHLHLPLPWLTVCLQALSSARVRHDPERLTSCIVALATLHRAGAIPSGLRPSLLSRLLPALRRDLHRLAPASLAGLTWAMGVIYRRPGKALARTLLLAAWRHLPSLSPRSMAFWLWGCARLRLRLPASWCRIVLDRVGDRLPTAPPAIQALLLKSLALAGVRPSTRWMASALAAMQPQLGNIQPATAAGLLQACARLQHVPSPWCRAALWRGLQPGLPRCSATELCMTVVAAQRLGARPEPQCLEALHQRLQAGRLDCDVCLLCAGLRAVVELGSGADTGWVDRVLLEVDLRLWSSATDSALGAAVVDVLWALARLRHEPPESWLHGFLRRVQEHVTSPAQLAMVLEALGALSFSPGRPWMRVVWLRVAAGQQALQSHQLVRAFLASTRLRHRPPRSISFQVLSAVYHGRSGLEADELAQVALALAALRITPTDMWLHAFVNTFRSKVWSCSSTLAAAGVLATTALCLRRGLEGVRPPLVPDTALRVLPASAVRAALKSAAVLPQEPGAAWVLLVRQLLAADSAGVVAQESEVLLRTLGG